MVSAQNDIAAVPPLALGLARQKIVAALLTLALTLVAVSLVQDLLAYSATVPDTSGKIWRLDVDNEMSVYTWFSSSLILANAALLALITREKAARREGLIWHWGILAVLFVLLSADESLSLHEWLSHLIGQRIQGGGLFHFVWVIPALLACLIGAVSYIPLIRALSPRPRLWLIASALVYLGGAVGMEMVAGRLIEQQGIHTMGYRLLATLEELLEGLGMIMFLHTLFLLREEAGRRPNSPFHR